MRITEAPKDYTVVYDDTEESSSALEEEQEQGDRRRQEQEQRRGVRDRIVSLERKGVSMEEGGSRSNLLEKESRSRGSRGNLLFGSNRDIIKQQLDEEFR